MLTELKVMRTIVKKIGTDPENEIQINGEGIAEVHARLSINDRRAVYLSDTSSKAGTLVNGKRIQGLVQLRRGDEVVIGSLSLDWEKEIEKDLATIEVSAESVSLEPIPEKREKDPLNPEYIRPKSSGLLDELEEDFSDEKTTPLVDENTGPVGQMLHQIQYPENRARQHRFWILIPSIVMLATLAIPYLSWFREYAAYTFYYNGVSEYLSGTQLFLELIEMEPPESTVIIIRYLLFVIGIPIVALCSIALAAIGVNAWKPRTDRIVKNLSLAVIITMAALFLSQWLWYMALLDDASNLGSSMKTARYLSFEMYGIGYWLCFISAVLIYRGSFRRLWQPDFFRKWATLSFSFWMPFIMLFVFASSSIGFMVQEFEMSNLNPNAPAASMMQGTDKEMQRTHQSGIMFLSGSYYLKISEFNREDKAQYPSDNSNTSEQDRMSNIWTLLFLSINGYFVCMSMLLFDRKLFGLRTLILAATSLLALFLIYLGLSSWIDLNSTANGIRKLNLFIGPGLYISAAGSVVIIVEQIIQFRKKGKSYEAFEI
ncbi:MAG: hypothetical protein ACJAUD_000510 [Crocinitomicaceae bacterium]|jgi:hypothetical protein